ncbi:hypothetical protein JNW89_03510 [Micromonospora sp. 4G55]|nr:hypothetical protein [Micromonospora sp. 4G55]
MKTRSVTATVLMATLVTTLAPLPVHASVEPTHPPTAEQGWVTSTLRHMSLEQKVGQLFATYVYGSDATEPTAADRAANRAAFGVETPAEVIDRFHLGGVCYFSWSHNLDSPRQIAGLSNGLQRAALGDGSKGRVPLLISTDQEQGTVLRMPAPAAQFPGAMALAPGVRRRTRARRRRSPGGSCARWASTSRTRRSPTSTSTPATRSSGYGRSAPTPPWWPS